MLDPTQEGHFPALASSLRETGIMFRKLLDLPGTDFNKEEEVSVCLGIRSVRTIAHLLSLWRAMLSKDNVDLICNYCNSPTFLDSSDLPPILKITPNL